MNIPALRDLVTYESDTCRTAELAALFVARSVTVEPISSTDIDHFRDHVMYPKPEFDLAPAYAARIAEKLVQIGEALNSLAIIDCSHGLSPAQERNRERNAEMATKIGEALGFKVETHGDPRGSVLKLVDPNDDRAGDNWGGGWGVYR